MIAAATELVLDGGVHGFTIDEVARRSGVAKTTIYRHFPDTSELLCLAVDRTVVYPDAPDTGSMRDDLIEFLRRIRPNFADRDANAAHFELFAAMRRDPDLAKMNRGVVGEGKSPLTELYHWWRANGEIRDDLDLLTVFEIVDGPFAFRAIVAPESLEHVDYDALADRILLQLQP